MQIRPQPTGNSKSRGKAKMIESRLFASARKIDDRLTLITRSSFSDGSVKNSNVISGVTKSGLKKSLFSPQKLSINKVISEVFVPLEK